MAVMALFPGATVLAAAVLVLLPWGVGDQANFVLPLVPLLALHYWGLRRPELIPAVLAFGTGLAVDVIMHGPVGFWALLFLAALAMARAEQEFASRSGWFGRLALTGLALATIAVLEWIIGSIYYFQQLEWRVLMVAALAALAVYPVLALLLMPIDRMFDNARPRPFARGA